MTDIFFTLLRLSLNVNKNSEDCCLSVFANTQSKDWERLFDLSSRQGVLLLSYGGLQYLPAKLQPPRQLKLRWCVNVLKGSERYEYYKSIITKLSNLFSDKDVEFLLIKGVTISELYPVPYLRESGDIDIYLPEESEQANDLIVSLGVRMENEIPKHTTFVIDGIPIENHHTFFDTTLHFQREGRLYQKMENILRGMLSEGAYPSVNWNNVFQLPPQVAALYFIGHTFRHFCCLDMNIRQLCDWTIFFSKHKNDIDSKLLSSQIAELGLEKFVCHINSFCADYLGFNPYFMIPSEEDAHAERFIMKTVMPYRATLKMHIPVVNVLRYLFRRNNIYRRYLGKVGISEFLLPEIRSYFAYLLKRRWRQVSKVQN
ncbi:nucleotidyltransferase family protein [Dysgonomonas sp. 25]|uniref:nucleotidyltransferase domain-containing protein n=1 Tax=Dysgonomonas sp. 25 TaxID=2302933 RepID=UPI0013D641E6|nr:nucleotidyltransferase family protein [Dysgonomonas sp. 25]